MLSGTRRSALAPSLGLLLLATSPVSAHDPFEITTDAHLEVYGLNVHTTLSLESAARMCLNAPAVPRFRGSDFPRFFAQFEACARDFYALSSGGAPLAARSLSLSLSPEDDLEIRAMHERPAKSPLVFDAARLRGLPAGAGVVLTVTGQRSFLGQKLLTPDDTRFEVSIAADGEAVGTPPLSASGHPPPMTGKTTKRLWFPLGAALTLVLVIALRWVVGHFVTRQRGE